MFKRKKKVATRRTHSAEAKAEVVKLILAGARTIPELSRELGIADSLIRAWVQRAEDPPKDGGREGGMTASEKEELSHLRREVKVLRMEREILKRAATFFAKENT